MAALSRLQLLLGHLATRTHHLSCSPATRLLVQTQVRRLSCGGSKCFSSTADPVGQVRRKTMPKGPELSIHPESGLADEMLDIQASGLEPGQLVTLRAQVHTEDGKYRFLSTAQYKAALDGSVKAQRDQSLGGSYEGIEPMGLIWGMKPSPEHQHKHPRLVKWNASEPFSYNIELLDGSEDQADSQRTVLDSKVIERRYLADYVEQIPLSTGEAEGVLFLPKERGSSDPLPLVIDIRGLLTRLVVDRAAILASHGFAVFAFNHFLPRRLKTMDKIVYVDGQAFLDVIEFVKGHPRLDETRIGITSSCYGGNMMLHAVTRLNLPVKCLVGSGFSDGLSINVGFRYPDGRQLEPFNVDEVKVKWQDEHGHWWIRFTEEMIAEERLTSPEAGDYLPLVENINCPFLMFAHGDDHHISSEVATLRTKKRMEQAGKGHLIEFYELPHTGHFLEVPYQAINVNSSLVDPSGFDEDGKIQMCYTCYGGHNTTQAAKDQQFAWRKIVNFFRKHLEVKEMYRTDWVSD